MKQLFSILICFSFVSLSFAEDHPLPPLEDFVLKGNNRAYIMQRCIALYEFHIEIQDMQKELKGEEYDNTRVAQYMKNALSLSIYQQFFFPSDVLSDEKQSELVAGYMRTKTKFIQHDNAICGEVVRLVSEHIERIESKTQQ